MSQPRTPANRSASSASHDPLAINQSCWDEVAKSKQGRTALPAYGPLCPGEEELQLLGELTGKRVLELGCGDGKSLVYLHQKGAAELHGLDLSKEQLNNARTLADTHGFSPILYHSPMERDPGIPHQHFDLVLSIYALGWTTQLSETLVLAFSYLRPGGRLLFSWEHPFYSCLGIADSEVTVRRSYSAEGPIHRKGFHGVDIVMHSRKLSTFVNELCTAGFRIETMIEGDARPPRKDTHYPRRWYREDRAALVPTTLLIVAGKPDEVSTPL